MIEVKVAGVALDSAGQHVILLRPIEDTAEPALLLPIWIGAQEATSILVAVQGVETPRPLAHDLMRSILEALDTYVTDVRVTAIVDGTFYAEIELATSGGPRVIDSRPSDAIALASRVGVPIHVAEAVFTEVGVVDARPEAEVDVEEFARFLDTVDPDDFRE